MTSGLLSGLGVDMGASPMPTTENRNGAMEDPAWIALTQRFRQIEPKESLANWLSEAGDLVARYKAKHRGKAWGFKSALTHYCIGSILQFFNDPRFVIVSRNPLLNAKSYQVHSKASYGLDLSLQDSLLRIAESNMALAKATVETRYYPQSFVGYEQLKADPISMALQLAEFVGASKSLAGTAAKFIDPSFTTLKGKL